MPAPTIAVAGYKRYQVEVAFKNNGLELCGRYIACQTAIAAAICSLLPTQCSSATEIWNMYKSLDQCVNSWEALAKLFVLAYEIQVLGIATIPLLLDDGRCSSSTATVAIHLQCCRASCIDLLKIVSVFYIPILEYSVRDIARYPLPPTPMHYDPTIRYLVPWLGVIATNCVVFWNFCLCNEAYLVSFALTFGVHSTR